MEQTFRLKKSVKYLGMAGSIVSLAAMVWGVSIFYLKDPVKHGFGARVELKQAFAIPSNVAATQGIFRLRIRASHRPPGSL
jgi:hypothetical protein